ncbi:MAG: hypothetical protein FLDDKLPJ_01251 [Phycisphaerae bacterium]|nr:hypothetical protein [Phycisphaerae bacterium]
MNLRFGCGAWTGLIVTGLALPGAAQVTAPRLARGSDTALLVSVLNQRVSEVAWEEEPFEKVIDWLQTQGPINVVPHWKAMELEGITRDTLVTVNLRDTTVREVVNQALEWVREGTAVVTFQGTGNTLRISTQNDFNREENFQVKVYDVTDILARIPDFRGAVRIDIETASQGTGQNASIFRGGPGGDDEGAAAGEVGIDDPQSAALQVLIEQTIEPASWIGYGGAGSIRVFNRQLVIRNSIDVHEKIGGRFVIE